MLLNFSDFPINLVLTCWPIGQTLSHLVKHLLHVIQLLLHTLDRKVYRLSLNTFNATYPNIYFKADRVGGTTYQN